MKYVRLIIYLYLMNLNYSALANQNQLIDSILYKASVQLQNNDFESAFYNFNKVSRLLPGLKDDDSIKAEAYYSYGKALGLVGAHEAVIDNYQNALAELNTSIHNYHYWKYHLIGAIGTAYLELEEYDSSRLYFQQAIDYSQEYNSTVYQAAAFNNMGMFQQKIEQYSEAIDSYLFALKLTDTLSATIALDLRCALRDNLARCYLSIEKFSLAEAMLQRILQENTSNPLREFKTHVLLVKLYLLLNNTEKAKYSLEIAKQLKAERRRYFNFKLQNLQDYSRVDLLKAELQIVEHVGDYRSSVILQKELQEVQDSINNIQLGFLSSSLQSLYVSSTSALQSEVKLKENQVSILEKNKSLLILSICGLIAVSILLIVLYNSRIRNIKITSSLRNQLQEQQLINAKKIQEATKADLEHRQQDIKNLVLQFDFLKSQQEKMVKSVRDKLLHHGLETKTIDAILQQNVMQEALEHRFSLLRNQIATINHSFFSNLQKKCPELSVNELELCSYLLLGISTKDIALIRNVAPDSIKKAKYRLRRKLGLDAEVDIYSYIKSIA